MRLLPLAVLLSPAFVAEAHHSAASFDQSVEVFVDGTVTELTWANPHTYFAVEGAGHLWVGEIAVRRVIDEIIRHVSPHPAKEIR